MFDQMMMRMMNVDAPWHAAWRAEGAEKARRQAVRTGDIFLEGLPKGHVMYARMGGYELMQRGAGGASELLMVHGGGVWRAVDMEVLGDGTAEYVYFGSHGKWVFGLEEHMRTGAAFGWLVASDEEQGALTPAQVKCGWKIYDGSAWVAAPNLRVRQVGLLITLSCGIKNTRRAVLL